MDLKKLVAELGVDYDGLRAQYEGVSSTLRSLGLTDYEARAYFALVALGSASANFVASIAQIPRTSAYKVMRGLERKGYAKQKPGRPVGFVPTDPVELSKKLMSEVESCFGTIATMKDFLSEKGIPQLVYTIMGRDRVLDKIGEMMDKAERAFVISSPSLVEIRRRLSKQFSNSVARGVQVTVITSPFVKAPPGAKVVRRSGLIATDVVTDGRTALLAAPDLSACGYTDNEALAKHLEDFLRIMTESAG